jgi:photosystem II stability/assembly factor-like uncharacterized protein
MKKSFLILALCFLPFNLYSQSGWFPLQSGTNAILNSVYFPPSGTGDLGYVAGASGTILITTNAGNNWVNQPSNTSNDLTTVYFINSLTGWSAGGLGTIIHTSNGGTNWTLQTPPTTQILHSIFFINQLTGWAVGWQGTILNTIDGGTNWVNQVSTSGDYLWSVYFTSPVNGTASGRNGRIIKTTNAGANWFDIQYGGSGTFYSIFFANPLTGWTVGLYVSMITTNGGYNWSYQPASGIFLSVHFPSVSTGWRTGSDGVINCTTNSGTTWSAQTSNVSSWLYSVYFTSVSTGYIAGDNGTILKTTDGGRIFTGIKPIGNFIPNEFLLEQNYPNPFNPFTNIRFDIPSVGNGRDRSVQLTIYDVLGREVAVLVNEKLNPGS